MDNNALDASTEDVRALARLVGRNPSARASETEVIELCRALLIPEPAIHGLAALTTAERLFSQLEAHLRPTLGASHEPYLQTLSDVIAVLRGNSFPGREHLRAAPPPGENPFKRQCLISAPLYSVLGLVSLERADDFSVILAEALAAGMRFCTEHLTVAGYLSTLALPSGKPRLAVGHGRLAGGGRALRWLSEPGSDRLLAAIARDLRPGRLFERLDNPTPALRAEIETLSAKGRARINALTLFLGMAVGGDIPGTHTGGGSTGPRDWDGTQKGVYGFWSGNVLSASGRDFVDDDPEFPATLVNLGLPADDPDEDEPPGERVTPDQVALFSVDENDERSLDAQILAARHKASLIERANQALPFAWGCSTDDEIQKYVEMASRDVDGLDAGDPARDAAMASAAVLATGCSVHELETIRWTRSDLRWSSDIEYDLEARCWRLPNHVPAFSADRDDLGPDIVVQPRDHIRLPDYWRFHRFFAGEFATLSRRRRAFVKTSTELKASTIAVLATVAAGHRLSLERAANVLVQTLYQQNQDVGPLANVMSVANWHCATVAHYQTSSIKRFLADYRAAQVSIAPAMVRQWDADRTTSAPINHGTHVGARRMPVVAHMAARIAHVQGQLSALERPAVEHRVAYHNIYHRYVAAWLSFELVMRAIIDPAPLLVVEVLGIAYISDKQRGTRYLDRLGALSGDITRQLADCDRHSAQMRLLALANGADPSPNTFFILDQAGGSTPLRPKHFKGDGFELPYSINAFRRLARSYLSEQKVNGELIDAYLGHGRRGTERWNKFSTLPMSSVVDAIASHLDELRTALGWRVMESPHAR